MDQNNMYFNPNIPVRLAPDVLVVDASYRKNGTTKKCLNALCPHSQYIWLPEMVACQHCADKFKHTLCLINDSFRSIIAKIIDHSSILFATPVYCDFPSPKLLAFLSRLAVISEGFDRKPFKNKKVFIHANSYCSGTKAAIGIVMRACEMIGFQIDGRSTTEYIELWKDNKIRGGF